MLTVGADAIVTVAVAVAKNPDGALGIGISNFTSSTFLNPNPWLKANNGENAENVRWMTKECGWTPTTYTVKVKLPGASRLRFKAYRTNAGRTRGTGGA